jgi:hypothetical protein
VIGVHFFFDFIMPNNSQSYYLTKDFITNFFLFLVIPVCIFLAIWYS